MKEENWNEVDTSKSNDKADKVEFEIEEPVKKELKTKNLKKKLKKKNLKNLKVLKQKVQKKEYDS